MSQPTRRRPNRRMNLVLIALVALAIGLVLAGDLRRRGSLVELKSSVGAPERCASCHPGGGLRTGSAHPSIAGHANLVQLGCTPCHGGDGRRLDALAHGPAPGRGANPFWPKAHRQLGCARCHVLGALAGAPLLERARGEWLAAGCPGCHRPGGSMLGVGPDLRHHRSLREPELRRLLLDPRGRHPEATMWPLTDQTYRGRYGRSPAGESALQALVGYLWLLGDSPHPYRSGWARPNATAEVRCGECHRLPSPHVDGQPHRCAFLVREASLRCPRCHGTAAMAPRALERPCPQVSATLPLCTTCHLRQEEVRPRSPSPPGPRAP